RVFLPPCQDRCRIDQPIGSVRLGGSDRLFRPFPRGGETLMRLRRTFFKGFCVVFCAGVFSLALAGPRHDAAPQAVVTYTKDVAPILQAHCVACHRPNDIAPMSLMTYDEVLPFARMLREAVVQRKMPPWHADPTIGEFTNDARLSDADIATIDAWV